LLGERIANLVNLVNPEVVVLGVWVSVRLGAYMLPTIKQIADASALAAPLRATHALRLDVTAVHGVPH
jgi:predicted NBD/HSP70 family sugar kinase